MALDTTITGRPAEFVFTQLAASLDASAREHKRLSALHRRHAQNARRDLDSIVTLAASAGVTINHSEEATHG